jgi:hypothetical protein
MIEGLESKHLIYTLSMFFLATTVLVGRVTASSSRMRLAKEEFVGY